MNEKIKEFEKQCTEYYSNGRIRGFDLDKFAELIVKECASACSNHKDIESFGILPIRTAMVTNACENNIKDHFGVEE